jgi:hypothetical protein
MDDCSLNGAVCQVPGCGAYVGHLRMFFRRHRICTAHHQAAAIAAGGSAPPLRFCGDCCGVHSVSEFDANSRTCRHALALRDSVRGKVRLSRLFCR